jgi:hypothetical protein
MHVTTFDRTAMLSMAACLGLALGAADAHALRCDDWGCGANTGQAMNEEIGPLHLGGLVNAGGFRVIPVLYRFDWPAGGYRMDMKEGELIAVDPVTGAEVARRRDLEKSWFVLERVHDDGSVISLHVEISRVAQVGLFREPWGSAYATAYEFKAPASNPPWICPDKRPWGWSAGPSHAHDGTRLMSWIDPAHYAVLVGGETYEAWSASVDMWGPAASQWFNIACANTALSKMKLMGYDPQDTGAFPTTPLQRQSTLKMLTARYSQARRELSFTLEGQPLVWQNAALWFRPLTRESGWIDRLEGVWNEHGAICLNTPRRWDATEAPVWTRPDIASTCGPEPATPPLCPPEWSRLDRVPPGAEWVTFTSTRAP